MEGYEGRSGGGISLEASIVVWVCCWLVGVEGIAGILGGFNIARCGYSIWFTVSGLSFIG